MKVFYDKQTYKSWAIKLAGHKTAAEIEACDSESGSFICYLITFSNGEIVSNIRAKENLEKNGYNPYEYENKFDSDGRIILGGEI